jgi:hypothetical protein
MTVALRKPMSLAEFLAWEERQELRFEFDGFQPVAMTGGTFAHDQITFNLRKALDSRLSGKPCRPAGPNVKILTPGKARYPDGLVTCSPIGPNATVIDNPVVVFEVVSEDTARTDRIEKLREYQAVESIRRHVILAEDDRRDGVRAPGGDVDGVRHHRRRHVAHAGDRDRGAARGTVRVAGVCDDGVRFEFVVPASGRHAGHRAL